MNVTIHCTTPATFVGVGTVLLLGVDQCAERAPTPCAVEKIENTVEGLVISARPVGRDVKRRVLRCQPDDMLAVELTGAQAVLAMQALDTWGSDFGYSVVLGAGAPDIPVPQEVPADA